MTSEGIQDFSFYSNVTATTPLPRTIHTFIVTIFADGTVEIFQLFVTGTILFPNYELPGILELIAHYVLAVLFKSSLFYVSVDRMSYTTNTGYKYSLQNCT